jgi:UDP-N-acetylmuramoyl-tripeptide--D-alanyl-D-alanine ligase
MKELGPEGPDLHADLADLPAIEQIDVIHCIGPLMRSLYDRLPETRRGEWFAASEDALPRLKTHLDSGDVVLAKGSLSIKLAQIVDGIRKMGHAPLDEG